MNWEGDENDPVFLDLDHNSDVRGEDTEMRNEDVRGENTNLRYETTTQTIRLWYSEIVRVLKMHRLKFAMVAVASVIVVVLIVYFTTRSSTEDSHTGGVFTERKWVVFKRMSYVVDSPHYGAVSIPQEVTSTTGALLPHVKAWLEKHGYNSFSYENDAVLRADGFVFASKNPGVLVQPYDSGPVYDIYRLFNFHSETK